MLRLSYGITANSMAAEIEAVSTIRCEYQTVTATHNVDIAPMATSCVSIVDGLRTLRAEELLINLGDTSLNTSTFNLAGIDAIDGGVAIVFDMYGCGSERLCRVPDLSPRPRFVTSSTLRKLTGPVFLRRNPGMSGFTNRVEVLFPLLDSGSQTGIISRGLGGWFSAEFGTSEMYLGPGVEDSQPVGFGAKAAWFYVSDNQQLTPDGPDKFNLASNCRGSVGIVITNNTGLERVLLPSLDSAEDVIVTSNVDLHTLELGIANASNVRVRENGPRLNLTFPQLRSIGISAPYQLAFDGTFVGLSFISLPRLETTSTSGLIFSDNAIAGLPLPRLGSVNGSLTITNNTGLFDIGLPRLQTVYSDLILHDNPRLLNFTANVLKTASSIFLVGSFTNVEFFSLEKVSGNFEVIGHPSMDCSWFDAHLRDKVVKGSYTCVGNHTYTPRRPSTSTELPPDDQPTAVEPGSEDGGGLGTGAIAGIGAGAGVGGLVLIGLGVWAFLRWKRNKGDGVRGILPWGRKKVDPPGLTGKPELDGEGKPWVEKDGKEVERKDMPMGELPVVGGDGLPVARRLNAEGEVVEMP